MADIFGRLAPTDPPAPEPAKPGMMDALADTWPARVAKAIWGGVTLPGDVYAGKVDPLSDEGIGRAADLAGTLGSGGVSTAAARPGTAGIFGGKLAATADHAALARAEEMAAKGGDPSVIHMETGWFQGRDGKWRFEIPDNEHVVDAAALRKTGRIARAEDYLREQGVEHPNPIGNPKTPAALQAEALKFADQTATSRGTIPLEDYLIHDKLYEAYPSLREMLTRQESGAGGVNGTFDARLNQITTKGPGPIEATSAKDSTVLHEVQHAIQRKEGFTSGANPESFRTPENEYWQKLYDAAAKVRNRVEYLGETPEAAAKYIGGAPDVRIASNVLQETAEKHTSEQLADLLKSHAPHEMYRRVAGEVEARNVQGRMNLSDARRRTLLPWTTEDVPLSKQTAAPGSDFGDSRVKALINEIRKP